MMTRFARVFVTATFALLAATSLQSQELRGVVRDSASGSSVTGAVVAVFDSANGLVVRGISNQRGEYRLPITAFARRVRVVRLGFRPRDVALGAIDGAVKTLDIALVAIPIHLETVRTTASHACPRRADAAAALALLDQARAGLLTTIVSRASNPASVQRIRFYRRMEGNTSKIARQWVRRDSTEGTPFRAARDGASFVERGFMDDSAGAQTFYSPDAEVIIDAGFSNGYCFRVMYPVPWRQNQVGVGFSPPDSKDGRTDIEGAMWIDTARKALVDIEYFYRGLPNAAEAYSPGGHIEFQEMPNGVVFDRWTLRLVGSDGSPKARADGRRGPPPRYFAHESGGEIISVNWPDGTSWKAHLGTLRVHTVRRDGRAAVGTFVELDSTDYRSIADSAGYLTIEDLLPGPYHAVIIDDDFATLKLPRETDLTFEAKRDSTVGAEIVVPSTAEYVRDLCARDHMPLGKTYLLGRVFLPSGEAATSARWSTQRLTTDRGWVAGPSGNASSEGLFYSCSLESGERLNVSVAQKNLRASKTVDAAGNEVTIVTLVLQSAAAKP